MEQVAGLEPVLPVWKTGVLPLHHTCERWQFSHRSCQRAHAISNRRLTMRQQDLHTEYAVPSVRIRSFQAFRFPGKRKPQTRLPKPPPGVEPDLRVSHPALCHFELRRQAVRTSPSYPQGHTEYSNSPPELCAFRLAHLPRLHSSELPKKTRKPIASRLYELCLPRAGLEPATRCLAPALPIELPRHKTALNGGVGSQIVVVTFDDIVLAAA